MPVPYPDPIVSQAASAPTTGPGAVIDIGTADLSGYPPVMIVAFGAQTTCTYLIEGSHDGFNFVDFSGGGFTAPVAKDLIPGVRFWRTNVVSFVNGSMNSSVGAVPTSLGTRGLNKYIVATNATV